MNDTKMYTGTGKKKKSLFFKKFSHLVLFQVDLKLLNILKEKKWTYLNENNNKSII